MSTNELVEVHWQCQQLLNRVLQLMDGTNWQSLAECYTIDAELARPTDPDNPIKGREDILASFNARPPKTTCHFLMNSVFTIENSETVTAISRALLMSGPALTDTESAYPVEANRELLAGTFRDTLVKVDNQWFIGRRVGSIELKYG